MDTAREFQQDEHVRMIMTWLHMASRDDHLPEFVEVAHALLNRLSPHSAQPPEQRGSIRDLTLKKIDGFTQDPAERMFLTGRVLTRVNESVTLRSSHPWVVQSFKTAASETTSS